MKKLNITKNLIQNLVDEVAPKIENLTKWYFKLDELGILVLPKNRGYEEVVLGRLQGAGIPIDENRPRSILEKMIEYVIEANILGAYQSSTQELIIIRENVDESNINGLKLIVGHELVHRGQHVNFKHLFDKIDESIRKTFDYINFNRTNFKLINREMEKIKPIMSLLESHAHYIQAILKQKYYPGAKIESHFNIATILMKIFGKAKVSQYTERIFDVKKATTNGNINSLYSNL